MSLKRIGSKFGLRLALWYLVLVCVTLTAVFALVYTLLAAYLEQDDRRDVSARMERFRKAYEQGRIVAVEDQITAERVAGIPGDLIIRVTTPEKRTLFLSLPDGWFRRFDLAQVAQWPVNAGYATRKVQGLAEARSFEIGTFPLRDGNLLQVGHDVQRSETLLSGFARIMLSVSIPALLLGLLGGYLLTYRALQPIRRLTQTVTDVLENGRLETRVPEDRRGDELHDLVCLFNRMLGRIETLLRGLRESLDNIAHDLRTPAARLRASAETALSTGADGAACREALADCLEESDRIVQTLKNLMEIAEAEAGTLTLHTETVALPRLLKSVVDLYRDAADEKDIALSEDCPEDLSLVTDPGRLQQILAHLLDNALKFTPAGGKIAVSAEKIPDAVLLQVADTGPGIAEEDRPHIWSRLYRGDRSRHAPGMGLGLSITSALVQALGGAIEVVSRPEAGAVFSLTLPLQPPAEKASGNLSDL